MKLIKSNLLFVTIASLLMLSACNDSDSKSTDMDDNMPEPMPVNYSYQVTVSNLTYGQPMSPVAVVLHDMGDFWQLGMSASMALENLAESGDNTMFLQTDDVLAGASGAGILMPGMRESINVTITDNQPALVSVATMLVNTNDAFTGVNAVDIANLAVGESISMTVGSYDAGTEKNTEWQSTIPGPASGGEGEGFNAARDDLDLVAMHQGVVTADDGLSMSVLDQSHRFDNPTAKITISRLE
ncbi:hypothetical protein tinsulaeT_02330 [Thalassotalea insulae]|uniref:Spondin domain-containing protein n=2 Tax=Thalassotalea insulae TaxID=2056778 RepID=A0ABQ6GLJ3_9GAMM|nr:spondin domain-containing protein [Thalassotalea insulae]GLX76893.1 hypothetical protein tinsulaeT_02330 [Thalassotalea insulae]